MTVMLLFLFLPFSYIYISYSDPDVVQDWIFQMINIYPVWERGIFGKGIRIRVNDEGMLLSPISLLFLPARIHNYAHTHPIHYRRGL